MKQLFSILILLISLKAHSQAKEIYHLTFTDKSNFNIVTSLDHKLPKTLLIIDTTKGWNLKRFWLPDFDGKDKQKVIKQVQYDEHHPYFHSYLFSDTSLDRLFTDSVKQALYEKSKKIKSKTISLVGPNYKTIRSSNKIKGYYFNVSEPIFSDDKNFAFIDLTIFYKEKYNQPLNETYFGTICIVYQRQGNGWKKIAKKNWLIL